MRRFFVGLWLLNKRLYKKPSFVLILLAVPLLVGAFAFASRESSSMLTVAVAAEDPNDEIYLSVLSALDNGSSLIKVQECDREAAAAAVENGTADAAWLFPKGLRSLMEAYVGGELEDGIVTVIQREENVLMQMSREKLMAAMFSELSFTLYSEFVRLRYPSLASISDEELFATYESMQVEGEELFRIVYPSGEIAAKGDSFLLSPIRGLLAVLAVVAGIAACMYYCRDRADGCFDSIPVGKRFAFSVAYCFVAVLNVVLASLAALFASGIADSVALEILLSFALCFSAVAFSVFLLYLLKNEKLLGAVVPVVAVTSIVLSPIFINVNASHVFRMFIVPYGYLASLASPVNLAAYLAASATYFFLAFVLFRFENS